jgi:hypothetical protein
MDGSGGDRATHLPSPTVPAVSRLPHGGARWILRNERVNEEGPGSADVRFDLYAIREDGVVRVRLMGDPLVQYSGTSDWGWDEDASGATIALTARRYTALGPTGTVIASSCGIYVGRLVFDAAGIPTGFEAEPTMQASVGTVGTTNASANVSVLRWSPDMTRIVGASLTSPGDLFVADLAQGTVANIGPGESPDWSPDGSKIVCSRNVGTATTLETVLPDGSGRTTLVSLPYKLKKAKTQNVLRPRWSPDGAHVAFQHRVLDGLATLSDNVHRVAASGGAVTNLTPAGGAVPVVWR